MQAQQKEYIISHTLVEGSGNSLSNQPSPINWAMYSGSGVGGGGVGERGGGGVGVLGGGGGGGDFGFGFGAMSFSTFIFVLISFCNNKQFSFNLWNNYEYMYHYEMKCWWGFYLAFSPKKLQLVDFDSK